MAICDWPTDERPREKLLQRGPSALSDAELLAIFLRTGCAGKSAVDLARELLTRFGGLRPLLEADQHSFCAAKGLGSASFALLQAVLEMARRHLAETLSRETLLDSSYLVKQFLQAQLRHLKREVFALLLLDSQNRLLHMEQVSLGTLDSAAVYPREVAKACLRHHAAAVILAHNHPSGLCEPSLSDRALTRSLEQALALLDIRVLDHIIVGEGRCYSFAEQGLMGS